MQYKSPRTHLENICEIIMGQSPKGETYNTIGNGTPLLNGPTEFGEHHPKPVLYTTSPTKLCKKGDLLFCVRGSTTGRMNWANAEYCIGRGVGAFRAKSNEIDTRFIYYTLMCELPRLLSRCAGSVFPILSRSDLESFDVVWPDRNIRSAIASILGTLDDKIELNRKMNETLEGMARAIFKSWFVDFDPIPGHGPHKEWQDFPLGRIPKGWEVGKADELFNIPRETVSPEKFLEEVFDHYSIPAFDEGRRPKIERGNEIKSNKNLVPGGAVLISKLNPRIPRVWLPLTRTGNRAIASTEFLVAMPRKVTKEYLYSLFSSHAFMDVFATLVTGTSGSHQRVKPDYLLKMKIIVPPIPLVDQFTSLVKPILLKIAQNIEESRILAAIRDTLLPKLLSGEIRVKEAERFISNEHLA